jgi:hypothetical protein
MKTSNGDYAPLTYPVFKSERQPADTMIETRTLANNKKAFIFGYRSPPVAIPLGNDTKSSAEADKI